MPNQIPEIPPGFKSGYVALVGQPNVGKSTLMNKLLQFKLSIVTPKPQTTRHRILGILNEPDMQIVFMDTPGLLKPKYKLQEVMVQTAHNAVRDADLVLFMVEATEHLARQDVAIFNKVMTTKKPVVMAINKVDIINKEKLLPLIEYFHNSLKIEDIVPISALHGDGVDILKTIITRYLPMGMPYYPQDYLTEHPERFFVSEIIREKIFQHYEQEIPYSTAVIIDEFKERDKGKDFIRATIYVERSSQKGILIGKKGVSLKHIGELARQEIEDFLQRAVYLDLHVSVKEKWRSKDGVLRELGYSAK